MLENLPRCPQPKFAPFCPRSADAVLHLRRDSIETIGYSLILLSCLDGTHLRWEVHVGRWVMASLEQTSTRLAQDPEHERNPALDLLRSRVLLLWIVVGSVFFVLLFLSS